MSMLPLLQVSSSEPSPLIALAPFGLLILAGVGLLFLLNRRLRIFTRGTVAFMISALMIFTVIDGLDYLNDIKLNENHLREAARQRTVSSLLQTFLTSGPDAAGDQAPIGSYQEALVAQLKALEAELDRALVETKSPARSLRELKLVALDVGRNLVPNRRRFAPSHYVSGDDWGYAALLDDGVNFILIQGFARLAGSRSRAVEIRDVDGRLEQTYGRTDLRAISQFNRQQVFKNADYVLAARKGGTLLDRVENR